MRHEWPIVETETAVGLREVLAYLEEHGWHQGKAMGGNRNVCVGLALQMVGGGLCSPAAEAIKRAIATRNIEAWNDSRSSFSEVRAAFLKAIERENQ